VTGVLSVVLTDAVLVCCCGAGAALAMPASSMAAHLLNNLPAIANYAARIDETNDERLQYKVKGIKQATNVSFGAEQQGTSEEETERL